MGYEIFFSGNRAGNEHIPGNPRGKGCKQPGPDHGSRASPFVIEDATPLPMEPLEQKGQRHDTHQGLFNPRGVHSSPIFKEKGLEAQRSGLTRVVWGPDHHLGPSLSSPVSPSTGITAASLGLQSGFLHTLFCNSPRVPPVSYTHLTLPTNVSMCRSRWSPYH